MKKGFLVFAILYFVILCYTAYTDTLDDALKKVGLKRSDLGWESKGWWLRYPGDIPYKLRHFDDLFSEPLATISFTRTLGNSARILLEKESIEKLSEKSDGVLYKVVHALGVNLKYGGFRSYSANLTANDTSLVDAILQVYKFANRPVKFITFGTESPYPIVEKNLSRKVNVIPKEVQPVVGRLIINFLDAYYWAKLAFRNVSKEKMIQVCKRLNIGAEEIDALDYAPAFDDVAKTIDEASLWYAGLKCVEMLDETRKNLKKLDVIDEFSFDWETPLGWIRIRGTGDDKINGENTILVVDLGGDDVYNGQVAASNATKPIGLLLDCAGDDVYKSSKSSQGAGMCGIGILIDGNGNDVYESITHSQGVGQFGLGACIDLEGNDRYMIRYSGQGCGYFGIGILVDAQGDDKYVIHSDGQGLGGVAGVGTLVDRSGNDVYEAVRDPKITERPSYHSNLEVSVSNAQGCGMGRRGDGADGHSWAGGIGALIDVEGNDKFTAGNWSLGTGYWFGTGLVYEGDGDDVYKGVFWSQGSGAHFCIGALLDEGGNDKHIMEKTSAGGLAFGHDFSIALLVNIKGDDVYKIKGDGLGFSINRSVAMLIDVGGNDIYKGRKKNKPGVARFNERLIERTQFSTYFADSTSLGLFIDVGGYDKYVPKQSNNSYWTDPSDSPNWKARNFSLGWDCPEGSVEFLPIPEKNPSAEIN